MMICTFFGNRQIYRPVEDELVKILMDLIEHKNVNLFYVGNHGQFDTLVCRMLKTICQQYPVQYFVVTAYLPTKQNEYENVSHVLYPDGLETVPPNMPSCDAMTGCSIKQIMWSPALTILSAVPQECKKRHSKRAKRSYGLGNIKRCLPYHRTNTFLIIWSAAAEQGSPHPRVSKMEENFVGDAP